MAYTRHSLRSTKPHESHPKATPKRHQSHTNATLMRPSSHRKACGSRQLGEQNAEQGVELRAAVLAGDDETKVAVRRAAGILDEWRIDARRQQSVVQAGGFAGTAGVQGHDWTGRFGQWQAAL